MSDRLHAFEAIDNFRDYGDYATAAGRRIRPGRLLRSGHHARASDADLERLKGFGLGAVVDLRRPGERRDQPSRRHDGFDALVIEGGIDDGAEAPHITFLKTADLTPDSGRRFMTQTYRSLPFDAAHIDDRLAVTGRVENAGELGDHRRAPMRAARLGKTGIIAKRRRLSA